MGSTKYYKFSFPNDCSMFCTLAGDESKQDAMVDDIKQSCVRAGYGYPMSIEELPEDIYWAHHHRCERILPLPE